MYDIVHLDDETKEKLEEMLEHIIELDDLKNGWVKSDFSMTQKALEEVWLWAQWQSGRSGLKPSGWCMVVQG